VVLSNTIVDSYYIIALYCIKKKEVIIATSYSSYENSSLDDRNFPVVSIPWETGTPRKILTNLIRSGIIKKGNALDICSGTGSNAHSLAENGFEVTGVDMISHVMENRTQSADEYLKLPYVNNKFELVLDLGCFHHISSKDRDIFFKEIFRLLNDGGHYLIVISNYRNDPTWNPLSEHNLIHHFSKYFKVKFIKHIPSIQADGDPQYFYAILMQKK